MKVDEMNILLHACCTPCSLESTRELLEAGHEITIAYMNSNIQPSYEYELRCDTLKKWYAEQGIDVVEGIYNPQEWEAVAGKPFDDKTITHAQRCTACYRLRFNEACEYAAKNGYDAVCTTLSISPYQYTDLIEQELRAAGAQAGVEVLFVDFREFYKATTKRAIEYGIYRQNYCGCRLSKLESIIDQEQRKKNRAKARGMRALKRARDMQAILEKKEIKDRERAKHAARMQARKAILRDLREKEKTVKQDR